MQEFSEIWNQLPPPVKSFILSLAASWANSLIKGSKKHLQKLAFGDEQQRSLNQVFEYAFKTMLSAMARFAIDGQ